MRSNTTWIGTLLLSALLLAGTALYGVAEEEEPHAAIRETAAVMAKGDMDTGIDMLNKLAAQYPRSRQVRDLRARTSLALGRGEDALVDLEYILAMTPDDTEIMFMRCLTFEAMGRGSDVFRPCYIGVVAKKRQTLYASALAQDWDYVMAVMLAELPEAETIKQQDLEQLPSIYSVYNGTLDENIQEQFIKQRKDDILLFDRNVIKKGYDEDREQYKHIKTRAK